MESIISVKNLVKKFGDFTAVNNVSFEVEKGEIFAFLGPNGAGKSTTIKMLTTLLEPTSGEINLAGANPQTDSDKVRHSLGIVFQDPSLDDDLTALENMELHAMLYGVSKSERKPKIDKLLELVDLSDRKESIVREFSGGMKRRLEIARSLIHEPEVLFLDEPTLGLDPQTRNHMWGYIKDLNKAHGMTVFFTTHYMEEASRMAERVAIIDKGAIIETGSPEEIMKKNETESLEDAFIKVTGHQIRDEGANSLDTLRQGARIWGGRR